MESRLEKRDGGSAHGTETVDAPPSKAKRLASEGIRSSADVKRTAFALAEDVLNGAVAPKISGAAVSAMSLGVRMHQLEMRHAENHPLPMGGIDLLDSPHQLTSDELERKALIARLAEIDARRSAVKNDE